MRVTLIKDDNSVTVDGETYTVSLADLPADVHAVQWGGAIGEVEYRMVSCDHCGGRNKKMNETVFDFAPYQKYVDAWRAAKAAADAEKAGTNATGPQG